MKRVMILSGPANQVVGVAFKWNLFITIREFKKPMKMSIIERQSSVQYLYHRSLNVNRTTKEKKKRQKYVF